MLDPFAAAESVLYPTWGALFTGVFFLGTAFPWVSLKLGMSASEVSRLRPLCRKAAFVLCLAGWFLVPDTLAVEARETDALTSVSCRTTGPSELSCADGTVVIRESLVPHQTYTVHRLGFLGWTVAVELS